MRKALHVPLEIPPDRLALAVGSMREPAILESGPGFGESGRWSVYAAEPFRRVEAFGPRWVERHDRERIGHPDGTIETHGPNPLARLRSELEDWAFDDPAGFEPPGPDEPPFRGGLIGFLGYDLAPWIERLPRKAPVDSRLPDLAFGHYDTAVTVDHATGAAILSAYDTLGEGESALVRRVDRWLDALSHPSAPPHRTPLATPLASNFSRADYLDAVGRCLEYIRAGDIFQVNLSQRFTAYGRTDALDLYLRLRKASPSPFSAFLRWGDLAVVSASPEWFYQARGDRIVTRPIKGTRPRGRTPDEDARMVEELRRSPKDRAELTMIVDLERNDLGRVSRFGSVRVAEPLTVETFAQVHHLVATVEGRLRPDVGSIEVAEALFPGGSITGAPKIRAMEIIDELEPTRRSLYTGAIGYFSFGASAFNIAIRTMLVEGDRVTYQVGGGIVADSDPEAEFLETLHKGRGLRAVLEGEAP